MNSPAGRIADSSIKFHRATQERANDVEDDPGRLNGRPPCNGPIRMLRLAQVLDVTGLGKTKIYELQAKGDFPMRVKITSHSVGWVEEEVQAWLARRVATSSLSMAG